MAKLLLWLVPLVSIGCGSSPQSVDTHRCAEFTQWERMTAEQGQWNVNTGDWKPVRHSWQQRSCTECGRVFQERLSY